MQNLDWSIQIKTKKLKLVSALFFDLFFKKSLKSWLQDC